MKFVSSGVIAVVLFSLAAATTQPASSQAAVPVNKKCPVSDEGVNPKGKTVTYKGKVVGFCCDDCIDLFNKNADKYADKIK